MKYLLRDEYVVPAVVLLAVIGIILFIYNVWKEEAGTD
jgi:ABC-type Fe3+-siderophore transport system permease subunit